MSKEMHDEIRKLLEATSNGDTSDVPQRVTNRMIFAAQAELYRLAGTAKAEAVSAKEQAAKNWRYVKVLIVVVAAELLMNIDKLPDVIEFVAKALVRVLGIVPIVNI